MYAIQAGSKFIKVQYYIDPDKVYNVVVSENPNIYKSRVIADRDFQRMTEWLDRQIANAEKNIAGNTAAIAAADKEIDRLKVKFETMLDMPFREVEKQVDQTRRAISKNRGDIDSLNMSLRSYKQDLARYNRIKAAQPAVVLLQQTVEAL